VPLGHEARTAATILTHTRPDLPARLHSLTSAAFQLLRPTSCSDEATQQRSNPQPASCSYLEHFRSRPAPTLPAVTSGPPSKSAGLPRLVRPRLPATEEQVSRLLHCIYPTALAPHLRYGPASLPASLAYTHLVRSHRLPLSAAHQPTSLNNTRPPTLSSKEVLEQFSWLY
jgi:hypothetical protein